MPQKLPSGSYATPLKMSSNLIAILEIPLNVRGYMEFTPLHFFVWATTFFTCKIRGVYGSENLVCILC
jgi:hypothetical protein